MKNGKPYETMAPAANDFIKMIDKVINGANPNTKICKADGTAATKEELIELRNMINDGSVNVRNLTDSITNDRTNEFSEPIIDDVEDAKWLRNGVSGFLTPGNMVGSDQSFNLTCKNPITFIHDKVVNIPNPFDYNVNKYVEFKTDKTSGEFFDSTLLYDRTRHNGPYRLYADYRILSKTLRDAFAMYLKNLRTALMSEVIHSTIRSFFANHNNYTTKVLEDIMMDLNDPDHQISIYDSFIRGFDIAEVFYKHVIVDKNFDGRVIIGYTDEYIMSFLSQIAFDMNVYADMIVLKAGNNTSIWNTQKYSPLSEGIKVYDTNYIDRNFLHAAILNHMAGMMPAIEYTARIEIVRQVTSLIAIFNTCFDSACITGAKNIEAPIDTN